MDRLNHFTPYNRKESHHEDQLTRALLVTLKYVPMAQALFIDLVREAQIEGGSESPIPPLSYRDSEISSIETQVTKIRAEEGRLVSIVLSDDQWKQTHVVKASSRRAVYDGIILYEPGWILIIENKPRSESIWPEQLNPSLAQDSQIEIDPVLVNLSWRSVIEHLSSLAERNLVVGAEKLILDDFFDFVDKHFTYLNPYDRFSKCKNEGYLLAKRCVQIMENLRLGEVKKHRGWKEHIQVDLPTVKMIALSPIMDGDVWRIVLEMYPGDTTVQARNFYSKLDINSFLALQEKGWTLAPNMHFSFITKILYHVQRSPILLPEYLKYWMSGDRPIQKVWRDTLGFEALFDSFLNEHIISEQDLHELDQCFTSYPRRDHINLCPGVAVRYGWDSVQACYLDDTGHFLDEVKEKIREALVTWGEDLVDREKEPDM